MPKKPQSKMSEEEKKKMQKEMKMGKGMKMKPMKSKKGGC